MDVQFVPVDLRRLDELKSEALALPFFEDERPPRGALGLVDWRLSGLISRALVRGHARGALGDCLLVPARPRLVFDKLILIGAGPQNELTEPRFCAVVDHILATLDLARVRASVLGLPGRNGNRIAPERAMELFLSRAASHMAHVHVTLIEDTESQRRMIPVVEREKRRARALAE